MAALPQVFPRVALSEDLKRRIGQHFVLGFHGYEIDANVTALIREYHVGNIILMKRNVKDIPQLRKLINSLQRLARDAGHARPLMIGMDQENGLVSAFSTEAPNGGTLFPGAMALAATGSPELVQTVYHATAAEMKLAGLNWCYSPVADVNSDARNPVIGVRSFGDDPYNVSEFVRAASRGLTLSGIAPTLKHFPGHGGTHVDSHLDLPKIPKSLDDLYSLELVPFKALIHAEPPVASIMTAHIALPFIIGSDEPASLSHKITTEVLRMQLGYSGAVVTDCLEMDAIAGTVGVERGAVQALQAGADIVMICHTFEKHVGAVKEVWKAFENAELMEDMLDASDARVDKLKESFAGSWGDAIVETNFEELATLKGQNQILSLEAHNLAVTVVHGPSNFVPISHLSRSRRLETQTSIILFTPAMEVLNRAIDDAENIVRTSDGRVRNAAGPSYEAFAAYVSDKTDQLSASSFHHELYMAEDAPLLTAEASSCPALALAHQATTIIFAIRNAHHSAWQLDYFEALIRHLQRNQADGILSRSVYVVSTYAPYDIPSLQTRLASQDLQLELAYLASFDFTCSALKAVARVIFGDIEPQGKVPVSLAL
ncbi:glycoside hydrolase [Cantharellus anzutake]|uniref:glycoside hydrolase n=1 Tax=Cantharellus anzutake TaxID=1750568 RepID=UPI00190803D1|nr:glycoside hydrolase [Cantharellus anzutake]KAF8330177.1 glycoside hydrolase [Cantharellus anzutake]